MFRPRVSLENYKEFYEFYKEHEPGKYTSKFMTGLMRVAFKPNVIYEPGADEEITRVLSLGRTVVLASNHTQAVDPCIIAAVCSKEKTLYPLVGNSFIPSKHSIQSNILLRRPTDALGSVPVIKTKHLKEDEDQSKLSAASAGFLRTSVHLLNKGKHMPIFPEGERNKIDPTRIQATENGVGVMIGLAKKIEQPAIIPMAIHYFDDNIYSLRHPTVYIAKPNEHEFSGKREINEWIPEQLQLCVDAAIKLSRVPSIN